MRTNIKFTDTENSDHLKNYTHQKIESFSKLLGEDELESAVCAVEFRKSTHHQKGDVCVAEVNLDVGGKLYRSTKHEKTLEKAIDKVKDDVLAALRTDKEKNKTLFKKGAAQVKDWLRKG
jgi:ribosome-associated translation inhibitor RaiA